MKNNKKNTFHLLILASIIILFCMVSCKKVGIGYLSDSIRYATDTLRIEVGKFYLGPGFLPDNSSYPFIVKLLDIRNAVTGKREEAFFKEYEMYVWKQAYNPATDTTLELINAKRALEKRSPLIILEKSGQILINEVTTNVPQGKYLVDIEISNSAGTKQYIGMFALVLGSIKEYEINSAPYYTPLYPNTESLIKGWVNYNDVWLDQTAGTGPHGQLVVKRVADAPNQIVFKVLGKNNKLLPPSLIINRPGQKSLRDFCYKTTVTDTAILYDYAATPFPHSSFSNKLVYCRITPGGISAYDSVGSSFVGGQPVFFPDKTTVYSPGDNSPASIEAAKFNLRFGLLLNRSGKYVVEMKQRFTVK